MNKYISVTTHNWLVNRGHHVLRLASRQVANGAVLDSPIVCLCNTLYMTRLSQPFWRPFTAAMWSQPCQYTVWKQTDLWLLYFTVWHNVCECLIGCTNSTVSSSQSLALVRLYTVCVHPMAVARVIDSRAQSLIITQTCRYTAYQHNDKDTGIYAPAQACTMRLKQVFCGDYRFIDQVSWRVQTRAALAQVCKRLCTFCWQYVCLYVCGGVYMCAGEHKVYVKESRHV